MAAQTIERPLPNVLRFTLGGSDVATEVNLPPDTGTVSIRFIANDGKVAFEGVDDDPIGATFVTFDADTLQPLVWKSSLKNNTGRTKIYLASATGSTVVEVLVQG
jgi:hypothetical protein